MKKISIKKGALLQHKGDINAMVYEIESGVLKTIKIQ